MSVISPSADPSPDPVTEVSEVSGLAAQVRRYMVHLGLVAVALIVLVVSRFNPSWTGLGLELPSAQPQVPVATPNGSVESAVVVPTVAPTVVADTAIYRSALPQTFEPELPTHNFRLHVVEKNETPNGVAEEYGIEPATLLWGNPELSDESQRFQVGITLTILPTDGVLHSVSPSDTVELIAEMYGVDARVIIDYEDNHLAKWPHRPVPGTEIFVPGGEKQFLVWTYTANSPRGQVVASTYYDGPVIVAGQGNFGWPTTSWNLTQYYWWAHRAIDIGAATGTPVYASDGGTVIAAGWSTIGYGNRILLDHGNGFQTLYAHLSSIWVASGQVVYKGAQIGEVGSTGNSSGPHLHFEIRYNYNLLDPLAYLYR